MFFSAQIRVRPGTAMILRAALLVVIVLNLGGPLPATTVQEDSLIEHGWIKRANLQSDDSGDAPAKPCNYMYVGGTSRTLLYYGTSKNCRVRLAQHNSAINSAYDVMSAYNEEMANNKVSARAAINKAIADRALYPQEARRNPQLLSQRLFTSDTCIGINSALANISIYTLSFDDEKTAATAEACVLNLVVGNCNRKGNGTVNAQDQTVKNALQTCKAWKAQDTDMKVR